MSHLRCRGALLALALIASGCSDDSRSRPAATSAATTSAPTTSSPVTSSSAPTAGGRVAITPLGLRVDGRTRLLYGGEVQYFRIRDPGGDAARTQRLWAETLDQLVAAGMNLVTTYVPWDLHEPQPGRFVFSGEADLEAFLELCYQRDLDVVFKPGPFINSEWPLGMGSYGAIPAWFLQRHPGAAALGPDGKPFTTDLLGGPLGRQPSYFAPELLQATEAWFARLAPLVRRYVHDRPTIVGVQLDNETNFYFASRYAVGYSPHGLRQYRDFLTARYPTIADLNAAYGSAWPTFAQVEPPRRPPERTGPVLENRWHQDWFDAGKEGIARYHADLRAAWERLGVREPDVVFLTNDSPHTVPGRDLLLWDAPSKNRSGLAMLDAYPRQLPTSLDLPLDYPFLTSFFSKRFARSNDRYAFAGGAPVAAGKCYGAELEGGLFELPLLDAPVPVPPATTDHVLLQHLGRGSALAAVYVFRGGLNRDGSNYFGNAAVGIDGRPQQRYEVLRRYGRLVDRWGADLLESVEVEVDVAVAFDGRFDAPAAGLPGHPGRAQVDEAAAVFGLLEDAGLNPGIVDLREATPAELASYRLVVFLDPGVVERGVARLLDGYVRGGGHLVNLLHRPLHDERWQRGSDTETLLAQGLLGDGAPLDVYEPPLSRLVGGSPLGSLVAGANVNLLLPAGGRGHAPAGPFLARFQVGGGAAVVARDRTFPVGADGEAVAWRATRGGGRVTHFGTNPAAAYASGSFYATPDGVLEDLRALARGWARDAQARPPVVWVADAGGTAWARRVPGDGAFVFVASRRGAAATLQVELGDLAALGLDPATSYEVVEALEGRVVTSGRSGADLAARGLSLALGPYGTAALRIR